MDESPLPERCTLANFIVRIIGKYKNDKMHENGFRFFLEMFWCFFVFRCKEGTIESISLAAILSLR